MEDTYTRFMWMGDMPQGFYSDVYNRLLESKQSTMTIDECREYAKMVGAYDIEKSINEIIECRLELMKEIKEDGTESVLGEPLEDFVRNAFPFEQIFVMRY